MLMGPAENFELAMGLVFSLPILISLVIGALILIAVWVIGSMLYESKDEISDEYMTTDEK